MMNTLLFALAFVFASYTVNAQTAGAVISFEKMKHDFGDVNEGDEASFDFVFTNTGNQNLIIIDVVGSCNCTASSWPKEPILPGEKAVITASYDTKDKSGSFNKSLTITSNAIEETTRIFIKGNVINADGTSKKDE